MIETIAEKLEQKKRGGFNRKEEFIIKMGNKGTGKEDLRK